MAEKKPLEIEGLLTQNKTHERNGQNARTNITLFHYVADTLVFVF